MAKAAVNDYRRAGTSAPAAEDALAFFQTFWGKLLLVVLSVLMLSLAFAPFKQFYLAWFGLVPLLIVLRDARSVWRAMLWSWLAGMLFFAANVWWLGYVTGPGFAALLPIL